KGQAEHIITFSLPCQCGEGGLRTQDCQSQYPALGACASDAPPSRGGGSSRISRSGPSQGQRVSDWWLAMLGLVK
ncbi:hypothetical protein CH063_13912, partial [Colletotrichum higginsianum]